MPAQQPTDELRVELTYPFDDAANRFSAATPRTSRADERLNIWSTTARPHLGGPVGHPDRVGDPLGNQVGKISAGMSRTGRSLRPGACARPGRRTKGYREMKYMIMMFGGLGASTQARTPEWITGMHELMMKLDTELKETGEVVAGHGLVDPSLAKTVRFRDGAPVATDGPFAEVKESLAGYWIVDVSEDRAIEIASRVVAFIEHPMEVRQIMDEPPEL